MDVIEQERFFRRVFYHVDPRYLKVDALPEHPAFRSKAFVQSIIHGRTPWVQNIFKHTPHVTAETYCTMDKLGFHAEIVFAAMVHQGYVADAESIKEKWRTMIRVHLRMPLPEAMAASSDTMMQKLQHQEDLYTSVQDRIDKLSHPPWFLRQISLWQIPVDLVDHLEELDRQDQATRNQLARNEETIAGLTSELQSERRLAKRLQADAQRHVDGDRGVVRINLKPQKQGPWTNCMVCKSGRPKRNSIRYMCACVVCPAHYAQNPTCPNHPADSQKRKFAELESAYEQMKSTHMHLKSQLVALIENCTE